VNSPTSSSAPARCACLALGFLGALAWHPPRGAAEGYPDLPPFDLRLERLQAEPVTADDVSIEPRLARKPLRFGAAARAECPAPIPKTVSVDVGRAINYSSEIGLKELRQAAAGHYDGPVVGAYQVNIGYAADVDQTTRELDPGRFCAEPDHVILNVQITQTIHIPREFAADKCLSALALDHEKKQAQAADASMDAIQPKLLSALRLAIRRGLREPKRTGAEAVAAFLNDIQAEIEQAIDQIVAERARLSVAANTAEESERLTHGCGGRALQD